MGRELAEQERAERNRELARRIEKYADAGHGTCILGDPRVARIAQETLFHDHMRRYVLHAWCIMPNHVPTLLTPMKGASLETICRTNKSVSSTKINKTFGQSGNLWLIDYFDRFIREEDHFNRVEKYIEWNPVKAKLCTDPKRWFWSSANEDALARLESLERDLREASPR